MTLFNRKYEDEKVARLVKDSRVGFRFDQAGGRTRLMSAISDHLLDKAEQRVREHARGSFLRRHRWATLTVALVLVVLGSGAAMAQTDLSKPGDALHAVDLLQERVLLALPLPATQKARIQANIADERTRELDYVLESAAPPEATIEAIDESLRSLDRAVEETRTRREGYASRGQEEQTEKLNAVLDRLEGLAERQEVRLELLHDGSEDEADRKKYWDRLEAVREYRHRAHWQDNQRDDDKNDDEDRGEVEGARQPESDEDDNDASRRSGDDWDSRESNR